MVTIEKITEILEKVDKHCKEEKVSKKKTREIKGKIKKLYDDGKINNICLLRLKGEKNIYIFLNGEMSLLKELCN